MDLTTLLNYATACGCHVTEQAPMAAATSFRIGGPADLLIDIPHADAAAAVLSHCRREGIPTLFIGNGSNMLVGDRGIRGAVLRMNGHGQAPEVSDDGTVRCHAGVGLQRLCIAARDAALTGLEFAFGIPGSVGGALYMNAGAYGGQMADVVVSAECLMPQGDNVVAKTLTTEELKLGYRHSIFMEQSADDPILITAVTFRLAHGDKDAIAARMRELIGKRQEKQPLEYPSGGSFFKRPEGYFAGALVEQAGLKGYTVGGAQVSEKHAGFVINIGGATAADVRTLCQHVQQVVREKDGVELHPEVRFIGEF